MSDTHTGSQGKIVLNLMSREVFGLYGLMKTQLNDSVLDLKDAAFKKNKGACKIIHNSF